MRSAVILVWLAVLGACATSPHGRATRQVLSKQEISAEVRRVCALPAAERDAELQRIKGQYGVALYCGKE